MHLLEHNLFNSGKSIDLFPWDPCIYHCQNAFKTGQTKPVYRIGNELYNRIDNCLKNWIQVKTWLKTVSRGMKRWKVVAFLKVRFGSNFVHAIHYCSYMACIQTLNHPVCCITSLLKSEDVNLHSAVDTILAGNPLQESLDGIFSWLQQLLWQLPLNELKEVHWWFFPKNFFIEIHEKHFTVYYRLSKLIYRKKLGVTDSGF